MGHWIEEALPVLVVLGLILVLFGIAVGFQSFASAQEAKAFNRCNPGSEVTTWEAMWAEYRITNCKIEGK